MITDGQQTLFAYLRQKHSLISTLAYEEPGLPQFNWNSDMSVLSIDGHPLMVEHLRESAKSVEKEMCDYIEKLTLLVDFSDLLRYIDSRTDPDRPEDWFIDNPRENLPGTSIVSQDTSGLSVYSRRLFEKMSLDGVYFAKGQTEVVPCTSALFPSVTPRC